MPGSIRAIRHAVDPIRGRGRVPLSKRSKGHPEFRPTNDPSISAQERRIADALTQAVAQIRRETVLEAVLTNDVAGYGQLVLSALSEQSEAIQAALFEAFATSGEVAAIEIGTDLARAYRQVNKAGAPLPSEVALRFRFDRTDPRALEWVRRESSTLITNMVRSEQEAIREIVAASFTQNRSWQQTGRGIFAQLNTVSPSAGVREFADSLGSNLNGLTQRYERAVINRVTAVADDLTSRGITGTKALETMRKEGDKYAEKLRRARSRTIARTERMRAHNEARLLSFQQAIDSGLASVDHSRKQWQTGPFDVCPTCVPMQSVQAKVADPFILPNGNMVMSPPAHPNCRCNMTMVTDTRLYQPPQNLGTGLPGDPFRTTPRGFSQTGQELGRRPLSGTPMPVVPTEPPPVVEPAIPQPSSQYVIEGIEDARQATASLKASTTLDDLSDNGLTLQSRRSIPSAGKYNGSVDGVLNLSVTREGEQALDAMLDVGKRARLMLDDEVGRRSGGLVAERQSLQEAADKVRDTIADKYEIVQRQHADDVRAELTRFLDAMPNKAHHDDLLRWLRESDIKDIEAAYHDSKVIETIHDIISANRGEESAWRYVEGLFERRRVVDGKLSNFDEMLFGRLKETFDTTGALRAGDQVAIRQAMHQLNSAQRRAAREVFDVDSKALRDESQRLASLISDIDSKVKELRIGVLEDILSANRPNFGGGDAVSKFEKISGKTGKVGIPEVREALTEYSRRVPTEWLEAFRDRYTFGFVQRGFYSHYYRKVRVSFGTAKGWRSTLTHEMTHGHQYHSRQIQMAERLYLSRRSTLPEYQDTWFRPRKYRGDKEPWFDLGVGEQYTTKIYSDGVTELSTRASEWTWYGLEKGIDPEMVDYWLGVLLTL